MKLLAVNCNHCGAPLEVAAKARFVTCEFYGTQLKIERRGGAAWTELLEGIDERTERIEEDVRYLRKREKLEEIDEQWRERRGQLMTLSKDGKYQVPTKQSAVLLGLTATVFGIVWMIATSSIIRTEREFTNSRQQFAIEFHNRQKEFDANFPYEIFGEKPPQRTLNLPESHSDSFNFFPYIGLVPILVGLVFAAFIYQKAVRYEREHAQYVRMRRKASRA